MLRDGQEVSIDAVPFDSTQRTYVTKDGVTYKIDDGTSVIYAGVSGIIKGYRIFFGVDGTQVEIEQGDSLTIKDNKYFGGVETVTTVYTTPTNDIDVTYNAIDIQRMNASLGSGFLEVKEDDISVSGMTVTIQPQRALIDGITSTDKEGIQIPIDNGLSQLRTDLIVLRKTQTTARVDYFVKKGELGSTTPPELEQVAMGIYELPVCSIRVNANQTTLELSNIIDMRQTKDLGVSENIANSTMKRNEFGRADISDPLETNDAGIVNVGYAKEKAIEGYGQKTDCILKAGLNVDISYNESVLNVQINIGSEWILPNGTKITQTDVATTNTVSTDGVYLLTRNGSSEGLVLTSLFFSSNRDPEEGDLTSGFRYWYNYTDKTVFIIESGAWALKTSFYLPSAQITVEKGKIVNAEKLNSVSFFGKSMFIVKETEALLANGVNEDGTLKTKKHIFSSLVQGIYLFRSGNIWIRDNNSIFDEDLELKNGKYYTGTLERIVCLGGIVTNNGTVITSMTIRRPFFTADLQRGIYGDTNTLPASEIKELVDEVVTDLSLTVRTTIGSNLVSNSQYQLGNRSTNIIITSASGFGEIRFTATNDLTVTIPTAHRWIIGTDTSFVAGNKYIIAWDDGMWASMGVDL